MRLASIVGWPIRHSRFPLVHAYWLHHHGIEGTVSSKGVAPENLEAFLKSITEQPVEAAPDRPRVVGCSAAVPHKEQFYKLAELHEGAAIAVRAADVLWLEGGKLCVTNSETYGFVANLNQATPQWRHAPGSAVVFGAGGTARAIVYGLLSSSDMPVVVINDVRVRAEVLAQVFCDTGIYEPARISVCNWDQRGQAVRDAALVVNTLHGMRGRNQLGIQFDDVPDSAIVVDVNNTPHETDLLADARAAGLIAVDGLGMLLHQAVPAFDKWFGVRPDVSDGLRRTVEAEEMRT